MDAVASEFTGSVLADQAPSEIEPANPCARPHESRMASRNRRRNADRPDEHDG
jgi:hypothetical protein